MCVSTWRNHRFPSLIWYSAWLQCTRPFLKDRRGRLDRLPKGVVELKGSLPELACEFEESSVVQHFQSTFEEQ